MPTMELGRIYKKIRGSEAGRYCVVIKMPSAGKDKSERNFVLVTGPRLLTGVRRK